MVERIDGVGGYVVMKWRRRKVGVGVGEEGKKELG